MQLNIYKDYQALSIHAATEILAAVKNNPAAVLCFATGDTPRLTYGLMTKMAADENTDFSGCTFIGLDEWVGIPPEKEGSCSFFLETLIFKPLNVLPSQVHLFDGMSADTAAGCKQMDDFIAAHGGIDLVLVGVGMNGHIGFNEPGVSPGLCAHVINLDATTMSVGQKYFTQATDLKQGITLGLKQVLQSKKLIMMASGIKKAEVIKKALEEPVTELLPASLMRNHPHGQAMIDGDAASLLDPENCTAASVDIKIEY